ncbi:MAG: hypothetical protein ORN24_02680 [Burkholderiales bacterium]|nr:hypothetical protein [Burkholderiales bacterium]
MTNIADFKKAIETKKKIRLTWKRSYKSENDFENYSSFDKDNFVSDSRICIPIRYGELRTLNDEFGNSNDFTEYSVKGKRKTQKFKSEFLKNKDAFDDTKEYYHCFCLKNHHHMNIFSENVLHIEILEESFTQEEIDSK